MWLIVILYKFLMPKNDFFFFLCDSGGEKTSKSDLNLSSFPSVLKQRDNQKHNSVGGFPPILSYKSHPWICSCLDFDLGISHSFVRGLYRHLLIVQGNRHCVVV